MEGKWFLSIIQDEFRTGKINLEKTMKLLDKLNIPFDYVHVKYDFKKTSNQPKTGTITIEEFRIIYRTLAHRNEIHELFSSYSPNHKILPETNLIEFLKKEQFVIDADETIASELIGKYEPIEEVYLCLQFDPSSGNKGKRTVKDHISPWLFPHRSTRSEMKYLCGDRRPSGVADLPF